jgi:chaperonin GroEL
MVVRFGLDARRPTLRGVDTLADLVARTIGPAGRAVLVGRRHGMPQLCRNGYAIARNLELDNQAQQVGVAMARELAWRTSDAVGDGTKTAILVARALLRAGGRASLAGIPASELVALIEAHEAVVLDALESTGLDAPEGEALGRFAAQAACGEAALGALLAEAHAAAGRDGIVLVEAGQGAADSLRFAGGLQLDQGWISPHLVDDQQTQSIKLSDPLILLHAGPIAALGPMVRVLEMIAKAGRSLLIVADSLGEQALATLIANKRRAGLKVAAVKAPGAGPWRRLQLEDLALATGATLIAPELGTTLDGIRPQVMGRAAEVRVDRTTTTIIGGGGEPEVIAPRIDEIRRAIAQEQHLAFDREQHQKRLARLSSGIATLSVGGQTPAHLAARLEQAKNASAAIASAMAGGLVPGGSAALAHAAGRARARLPTGLAGELLGRLFQAACEAPLRAIVRNTGEAAEILVPRLVDRPDLTFDARRRCLVPIDELRDPLPVVRTAFQNAVATASRLLTVDCALDQAKPRPQGEIAS